MYNIINAFLLLVQLVISMGWCSREYVSQVIQLGNVKLVNLDDIATHARWQFVKNNHVC